MATPRNGTPRNGTSIIPKRDETGTKRDTHRNGETGHPLSFRRIQISMDVLIRGTGERDIQKGENRILINYLAQGQNQPLKTSGTWMVHPTARRTDKPVDT